MSSKSCVEIPISSYAYINYGLAHFILLMEWLVDKFVKWHPLQMAKAKENVSERWKLTNHIVQTGMYMDYDREYLCRFNL